MLKYSIFTASITSSLWLCSLIAASSAAVADPGGWSKAQWGMTDDQILAAFEGEAVDLVGKIDAKERTVDGEVSRIGIPAKRVGDVDARIFFLTSGDAGLHRVHIELADSSDLAFGRLEQALVEKYGRPWTSSTSETKESQWTLKSTRITLHRTDLRSIRFRAVWLTYTHRQADDSI